MVDTRVYGPASYRAWGYGTPCVVVGCRTEDTRPGYRKVLEVMHVSRRVGGGVARKGTWAGQTCFGCWRHHDEQGQVGVDTFAERHELAVNGVPVSTLEEAAQETLHQFNQWEGALSK